MCRYLQSVLQISCPAIDLTAFTAVANAAVDVGSGQTYTALTPEFTVPGSPMNIFLAGFFLEDVAVGMYQDLIPNIVSRDLLIAATGEHTLAWHGINYRILKKTKRDSFAENKGYCILCFPEQKYCTDKKQLFLLGCAPCSLRCVLACFWTVLHTVSEDLFIAPMSVLVSTVE